MIRFVADIIGHIPLSWKPPCPDRQVGEVAPAPRLDVLRNMVDGGRQSKMDRPLSKVAMDNAQCNLADEIGPNPRILAKEELENT